VEAGDHAARRAGILAFRSWLRLERDLPGALRDARAALASAEQVGGRALLAAAIARVAIAELLTGHVTPGLLERGTTIEAELEHPLEFHESPRAVQARYLLRVGDLDRARLVLEEAEQRAAMRGDEGTRGQILWILIMAEWLAGRWPSALEHAQTALELAAQTGDRQYSATVLYAEALVCAHLGQVERGRAAAGEALAISEAVGDETFTIWSLGVLGHLELASGDTKTAAAGLADLPARLLALGWADPMVPLWSDTLEALVSVGAHELARSYLEEYGERARRLDRPWAIEVADRSEALLAAAIGNVEGAARGLENMLARAPRLPYPFERGRTLLALGAVRRRARQKRAAREALGQALEIFEHLGARLWAEKARDELTRISGRRPRSAELTATELQVANLVAEGRSNKEVASALFMSVHTVEAHLSRVYRKLGIRSRTELARHLAKV
jgi:DNA-binding CsgD family transcriptional regulator